MTWTHYLDNEKKEREKKKKKAKGKNSWGAASAEQGRAGQGRAGGGRRLRMGLEARKDRAHSTGPGVLGH